MITLGRSLVKLLPRNITLCSLYSTSTQDGSSEKQNKEKNKDKSRPGFEPPEYALMVRGSFEDLKIKTKQTYLELVKIFEKKDIRRRNHVEFIYAALKNMEDFGVHKDLDIYKALANVLPKGKFIPTNIFQAEFMHYPKQQQCLIDLLEQMEDNGVIPDYELEDILINTFGRKGHPVRKFWRMMYWMPKFKNLSPWMLPNPVPDDVLELAKLAVERMCTVDLQSRVDIFETKDIVDSIDETWIVSGQSPAQSELLARHPKNKPLYIEGPFLIWLRNKSVNYFTLRGDSTLQQNASNIEVDNDDVSKLSVSFMGERTKKTLALKKSIHEQDDGTIYAICATGSSAKDSLLSWIRILEKNGNPDLAIIPVLFKFRSPVPNQLATTTM